tara:strand:- start:75 stop:296 length:222 start_codon:yes stop_codon:yes gene_type:complete
MAFKNEDVVLATAKVLRKNPDTGKPETLNFTDEEGTVKKARTYKDNPEKDTYWVKTQYGINVLNGKNLVIKPA